MTWLILCRLCSRSSSWWRVLVSELGSPNKSASENDSMQKCGMHGPLQSCMQKNNFTVNCNFPLPQFQPVGVLLTGTLFHWSSQIFLHVITVKSLKETTIWVPWIPLAINNFKLKSYFMSKLPQRNSPENNSSLRRNWTCCHKISSMLFKLSAVASRISRLLTKVWGFIQGDQRN